MDTVSPKLQEAVHYVCRKLATHPDLLGAVKLQKVLWYFDAQSYFFTGKTATGAKYFKKEYGPFSYEIPKAIEELVLAKRLFTDKNPDYHGLEKAEYVGKGQTNTSVFDTREIRWLDELINDVCEDHTAASISEKTHGCVWRMAQLGEEIPFAAVAVRFRPPSQETKDRLKSELV
jgi:hypothetical protein